MKVAVFWTNRSEEGLLKPVIKEMRRLGMDVLTPFNEENIRPDNFGAQISRRFYGLNEIIPTLYSHPSTENQC